MKPQRVAAKSVQDVLKHSLLTLYRPLTEPSLHFLRLCCTDCLQAARSSLSTYYYIVPYIHSFSEIARRADADHAGESR